MNRPRRFPGDSLRPAREGTPAALSQCFADEVAIDFPCLDRLIERERDTFLGHPEAATLTTEVSLSTDDAWRGAVVPLEVALRGTCAMCGGRGESWAEPCRACCGTGDALVRHPVHLSLPPRVAHGARLRFCLRPSHAAPVHIEVRVAVRSPAA